MQLPVLSQVSKELNERSEDDIAWSRAYQYYLRNGYCCAGIVCPILSALLLLGATLCALQAFRQSANLSDVERTFLLCTASCSALCAVAAYGFRCFVKRKASSFAQFALDSDAREERDIRNLFTNVTKF